MLHRQVLQHAFFGVLGTARERAGGAVRATDEDGPVGVQVLDLEHDVVPSVGRCYLR